MTVDDYLKSQPALLTEVREAIRNALPQAEESISYNMPTYKLGAKPVIYFAGWKKHYSLYPVSPAIIQACQSQLANCEVDKSTLRLPYSAPVPAKLIQKIAKLRAAEVADRRPRPRPAAK